MTTQGLSFDYIPFPASGMAILEVVDRNRKYTLWAYYCRPQHILFGENDDDFPVVPIEWLHRRADVPRDYLKLAFWNHCLKLLHGPEAKILSFTQKFDELDSRNYMKNVTTVECEFPIPRWPEWEHITDRTEFSVHVGIAVNSTLQVEEVLQRAQKAIRLLLRPVYLSAQEWELSGNMLTRGFLDRLQPPTTAISLDDLPFSELYPKLKKYFVADITQDRVFREFWGILFTGRYSRNSEEPFKGFIFAIEGLILSGNLELLTSLITLFIQKNVRDSEAKPEGWWLMFQLLLEEASRICHPHLLDVTTQVLSFCTTCIQAATFEEWPVLYMKKDGRYGYHGWASLKIPILPFGQVDGDINEYVATTLHFVNLTEWLDWDTYQWLATFCKIERFWNGSGAATNHYVVENHDRIKWVAETLAKRANENRGYTIPTDGLVVDIPSEFVREQLGLTKLLLHETSPGQLLFVALDDNERGIVGKWTVEQPALVRHFPAPFTDTPSEVAVILAACIAAVYHDVVVMADDVFDTVVAESNRPSHKHDQNQPVNGKRHAVKTTNLKGRLRHVRYKQSTIAAGQEKRQRVQHGVVGHLRRLPNGWRTPPERLDDVRQAADAHHIYIPPGYTFVVPHLRGGEKAQDHRLTRFVGLHRLESLVINMPVVKE